MEKEMLVVVDMLNDFVHPEGALYFPQGENIIENVRRQISYSAAKGDVIVYLKDSHSENDKEFERFPKHCVSGSWGAQIADSLNPFRFDEIQELYYISKQRYSGFYDTMLDNVVDYIKPSKVTVVGVCTSICVMDTVGGFANRDIETVVPLNCVADFDVEMHEYSLKRMENIYGTKII